MSILIKGAEMPKNCAECRYSCKHYDCPLVEIQSPHSRLIDADELYCAIIDKGQKNERGKYRIGDFWELTGREIKEVIDGQPTIIEAERERGTHE